MPGVMQALVRAVNAESPDPFRMIQRDQERDRAAHRMGHQRDPVEHHGVEEMTEPLRQPFHRVIPVRLFRNSEADHVGREDPPARGKRGQAVSPELMRRGPAVKHHQRRQRHSALLRVRYLGAVHRNAQQVVFRRLARDQRHRWQPVRQAEHPVLDLS